jgi:homoprotocatechuate degradation regulator HpaR
MPASVQGLKLPDQTFRRRNLPHLLLQAREALMVRFRPFLNANGVTEQQWRIIRSLYENGPMEPRVLSGVCEISGPSISGILTRMEEQGMVERARMDSDQRRMLVSLTTKTRNLVKKMVPQVDRNYRLLEEKIGVDVMQDVYQVLDQLLARLDDLEQQEAGKTD